MASASQLFSFDPVIDRDVLDWLERQPNKSAAIREAIRFYIKKSDGPTLADVMSEIRILKTKIEQGVIVTELDGGPVSEPEQAAKNLDGLLDQLQRGEFG